MKERIAINRFVQPIYLWQYRRCTCDMHPKSFQDSNGDGIGDIKGVIQHLDYLKELGINVIWICPVYKSPMVDHGYDISDYEQIDPSFGSNEDLDELILEADKRGIKILMDLVVNHTSDQHEWFQKAMEDLDSKYADYYIIKEGRKGEPPNNWRSIFGGSAWERIGNTNKYYLHIFTKEQPDLNWENKELRELLYDMVNRWLEKGLGGFRIDAISHIKKNFNYKNLPVDGKDGLASGWDHFRNVEGIEIFLKELKEKTFNVYDCFTIGEVNDVKPEELKRYLGEEGYFSSIFDFCHTNHRVRDKKWVNNPIEMVNELRSLLFSKQEYANGYGLLCNIIENHDLPRAIDRFIPEKYINYYSKTMLGAINFFLKGIPFIYQGQEIGMRDYPKKKIEEFKDPTTYYNYYEHVSRGELEEDVMGKINIETREHSRTPMQWTDNKNAGFSEGILWFEVNPNFKEINVRKQYHDSKSLLAFYKKMIAVRKRKDLEETFINGETVPKYMESSGVIAYERVRDNQRILVINNCNNASVTLELQEDIKEVLLNNYDQIMLDQSDIKIKPFQVVVMEMQ
ncbi:MAG: glycosidase [Lachnospiraceae bacterium]|nr:glycosidase [Lachnospiraceae bacterium]